MADDAALLSVVAYKARLEAALERVDADAVALVGEALRRSGTVYAAGNGGSAATAEHFVCDLVKAAGKPAVCLSSATASLTAFGNDDGYDRVFADQLAVLAGPDDILVVFSVSGESPNVVEAIRYAQTRGIETVALLGHGGSARLADTSLRVLSTDYGVVEDVHLAITHMLTEYLRPAVSE